MLRVEEFQHQNQICYRKELEGCPVVVTEQSYQATLGKLEYTRRPVRWKGRHLLILGDQTMDVDESLVTDCGPKLGFRWGMSSTGRSPLVKKSGQQGGSGSLSWPPS